MSPWRLSIGNSTLPPPTKNNALSFYLGLPLSSRAYLLKILASFFGQMKCRDTVMHVQKKSFSLPDSFIPFFASPDQVLQITHTQKKKRTRDQMIFIFLPPTFIYLFSTPQSKLPNIFSLPRRILLYLYYLVLNESFVGLLRLPRHRIRTAYKLAMTSRVAWLSLTESPPPLVCCTSF